ncbi:MAG: DUF2950 domain-containing protein [Geminicoccaceae bacterium]
MKDIARCGAALAVLVTVGGASALAEPQTFPSPGAAAQALRDALEADDGEALRAIFGPEYADDLIGSDIAIVHEEMRETREAMQVATALLPEADGRVILTIGRQAFPFPVPIVGEGESWRFDSAAGLEEILDRRIGENELAAIEALRAYVEAQLEYASADRDGDQVLEYAQRVISTNGQRDGLYWASAPGEPVSPFGPFIAEISALLEGKELGDPYRGYYYRVLKLQTEHAPGGAYDYVINDNMIAGFGLLAWPAEYGETGVMTFQVSHQGGVLEADLGPETPEVAVAIDAYDPDATWAEVTE